LNVVVSIVRYLFFLILIINPFYYNTLKLLTLQKTYRLATESHRKTTESNRIPTESHRKTTEYPQKNNRIPTKNLQNTHRIPT
jgi:hypothetical protein